MKKAKLILALMAAMASGSVSMAHADASTTSVSSGSINFEGQVVNAACSVAADSQGQTVTLDQVRTSNLTTAGEPAGQQKAFNILLKDCDTTTSQNASITFNGQTDGDLPAALKNNAGAGSATNVALQLYGPDGKVLNMGEESSKVTLLSGDTTIPLSVDYIATTAAATAGAVAATATFQVNYN